MWKEQGLWNNLTKEILDGGNAAYLPNDMRGALSDAVLAPPFGFKWLQDLFCFLACWLLAALFVGLW